MFLNFPQPPFWYSRLEDVQSRQYKLGTIATLTAGQEICRKQLAEEYVLAQEELDSARMLLFQQQLDRARIICMTLDCFNHIYSGRSALSAFFREKRVVLGVFDGVQQNDPHLIAAAAAQCEDIACFYDRAQVMPSDTSIPIFI